MVAAEFKSRIVALRKQEGLSQEDLAREVGVSKGAVQGWESGSSMPRGGHLVTIGRRFPRWTIDWLLGLTEDPTPHWLADRSDSPDGSTAGEAVGRRGVEVAAAEAASGPRRTARSSSDRPSE